MSRRVLLLLIVVAVALTGAAVALVLTAHGFEASGTAEPLVEVVGSAIGLVTGPIAWYLWPANRVGPLITALSFTGLASKLYWDAPWPFALAGMVDAFSIPLAAHLFLAFPSGRITSRFERRFVVFVYVAVAVLMPLSQLFVVDPRGGDCPDCPRNPLRVSHDQLIADAVSLVGAVVVVGVFVTLVVLLVRRLRASRGPTRRALAPVLATVSVALVLELAYNILEAVAGGTVADVLLWADQAAYAALPVAFLVGLLRTRLDRSAVADLVAELGSPLGPRQTRDAIARTLRDPSLELAFWLPEEGRYVDPDGNAFDPHADPPRAVTVLERDGLRLAALVHDPSLLDAPELVRAVGAAASLALENARLQAQLRAQLAEVRASRARIVEAGDAERRRLERDLHDGAQQRLLGIRLALQLARSRMAEGAGSDDLLAEADDEVMEALAELRSLARGIHPAVLTDEGLAPALAALARRAPVPVELRVCPERLPGSVEATVYFVAGEALANVAKHAHAAHVTIDVTRSNGSVAIEIADDGTGRADPRGAGLRGLRDRVEALDGRLQVDSAPGRGTRVRAALPCA